MAGYPVYQALAGSVIQTRCITLDMKWKASRATIVAALALVAAGWGRIAFAHDIVSGGVMIGLALIIAVRAFLYFRTPDA